MEQFDENYLSEKIFSKVCINKKGELCEVIDFDGEVIEVRFNCLREHLIYGICLAFNPRFETRREG